MEMLNICRLTKQYPGFLLDNVSFSLEEGEILGFIGRNGAGKTTTLKSMLGFVKPDAGSVYILDKNFYENEDFCKKNIGVIFGEFPYYQNKKISQITSVTRKFYENWDESQYKTLLKKFDLDENKKISQLSAGMKVKYSLALALSHNARLLLLDEPTSGLDPVSRDELMQIFRDVISDGMHSILFSTHILSDLDRCADKIVYIRNGKIVENCDIITLKEKYRLVSGKKTEFNIVKPVLISWQTNAFGFTGLMKTENIVDFPFLLSAEPSVEDIMIYMEKEENA